MTGCSPPAHASAEVDDALARLRDLDARAARPVVPPAASPPPPAAPPVATGMVAPGTPAERAGSPSTAQWALIGGVGQGIGAALPWAQTSILSVSVSPLSGLGSGVIFLVALVAAIVAVVSSVVMAYDPARAQQKAWKRSLLLGSIATLVCVALVLVAFGAARRSYGELSALVSPGIGLLIAAASAMVGVVTMARPSRR